MKVGILTVSDKGSKGERQDESGKVVEAELATISAEVVRYEIIPDEEDIISATISYWADEGIVDLILTTGGTGLSPRDVTPEATSAVIDKFAPGFAEAMRMESLKVTPMAMLSRGVSGVRKRTLIVNLPGSPKAVRECLQVILPALSHAIDVLKGSVSDCAVQDEA